MLRYGMGRVVPEPPADGPTGGSEMVGPLR